MNKAKQTYIHMFAQYTQLNKAGTQIENLILKNTLNKNLANTVITEAKKNNKWILLDVKLNIIKLDVAKQNIIINNQIIATCENKIKELAE